MTDFDLTYLSLGAGVQSTALYILSTRGERGVPKTDVAVFADTGDEPDHVYRQLDALEDWGKANGGARIQRVSIGMSLSDVMAVRWVPIPAFTRWEVKGDHEQDAEDARAEYEGFDLQAPEPGDKPRGKANRQPRTREGMLRRRRGCAATHSARTPAPPAQRTPSSQRRAAASSGNCSPTAATVSGAAGVAPGLGDTGDALASPTG